MLHKLLLFSITHYYKFALKNRDNFSKLDSNKFTMESKRPKISVIVPNYNHEKYLPKRIESIISQTFDDIEVIILDDFSSDNSREIIDSYAKKDSRIKTLYNHKNSGSTFKQWKKGLSLANGEYIWIAESDDYAQKEFIEKLLSIIDNDDKIGFVYSNSNIIDHDNYITGDMATLRNELLKTDKWISSFVDEGVSFTEHSLGTKCVVNNASSVLIRKSAIVNSRAIDTSLRYAGDWMLYIRIAKHHRIAYLAENLNFYREHTQNASKNANYQLFYERICCMMESYNATNDCMTKKKIFENALADHNSIVYNYLIKEKDYKKFSQYLIKLARRNITLFFKLQYAMLLEMRK